MGREIDNQAMALYGLTPEEIHLVEGSALVAVRKNEVITCAKAYTSHLSAGGESIIRKR